MTICVHPDRIQEMWPHVEHWIKDATDKCGEWTPDALYDLAVKGDALLWVIWDGTLKAACITQACESPKGKVLRVHACGGHSDSWPKAFGPIEEYAKGLGCNAIRIEGRKGWSRLFTDYKPAWVCIEKVL